MEIAVCPLDPGFSGRAQLCSLYHAIRRSLHQQGPIHLEGGAKTLGPLGARRVLSEFALERTPMNAQTTGGFGNVAATIGQHAIDVFPLGPG